MFFRPISRSLIVPVLGLSAPGIPDATRKVNLNIASPEQLKRLPGVGPVLADRIYHHCCDRGPFRRTEDLMEVWGIGERFFVRLKPYLAVSGPTTLAEKVVACARMAESTGKR